MRILILDSNHPLLQEGLEKLDFVCDIDYESDKSQIEEKIHNYHGIIIRSRFAIDKNFLSKARQLKFIARVGAGLENIDLDFAQQNNIHLIAAPEGNRNAVGEHTLGMLLSLFNKLNKADNEVRQGQWRREENRGTELDGKTVGLIGYGNMGKAFAKKLRSFDVRVIFYDIKEGIGNENATQVSLMELQDSIDVLSLHIPENPESTGMINGDFINNCTKPFWLINTARGKSVITKDLVKALKNGKILGAGLDVLEYEKSSFEKLFQKDEMPDAFTYLISSEKVLLSPHVAGWTVESHQKLAQTIVDKISAQFA